MRNYSLAEETLGYVTSQDPANTDRRFLIAGSKNVLIDYQKKVIKRPGYTRLGAAAAASSVTQVRNAWTWNTSTGVDLPQRFYDDELEVYLGTVDTTAINAWTRVRNTWSTTEMLRAATVYDATEKIDLEAMVNGDANIYEWSGAVAVVGSIPDSTHVTKAGTTTWAQNRFYTTRNMTMVCVRTGTEYTYSAGMTGTNLTVTDSTGLVAGDILIQKVVTQSNKPGSSRTNHFIASFQNQIAIGSEDDNLTYMSQDDTYTDFTFSSPRVAGEGAILTLDAPTRGYGSIGKVFVPFAGRHFAYQTEYQQITVGSTLSETLKIRRLDLATDQGLLNQESLVQIGNSLAYLSNEVALRLINNPQDLVGINPKTYSNPIKPDFDAEDWYDANGVPNPFGAWYKNTLIITAPTNGHTYMLNFVEDADGKLFRFWNPPQTLPIGPMSVIDSGNGFLLHGHSNAVEETYVLFDGQSDGQYEDMDTADKLPIEAVARFGYDNFKKRGILKTFDEYYVDGEITPNTTSLTLALRYDFDGSIQTIERTIDGSNENILKGLVGFNSLAQQSLGIDPLGSLLNPPSDARKFAVILEIAREDFNELGAEFYSNDVDLYWAINSHGSNASISPRRSNINRL